MAVALKIPWPALLCYVPLFATGSSLAPSLRIVLQHRFMVKRRNLSHLLKLCISLASLLELHVFTQHFYCLFRWACGVIIGLYLYESRPATLQDVAALFCVDAPLIHLSLNFTHEDPITYPSMWNKYVHILSVICFLPLQNACKWIWRAKWNECREGGRERRLNTGIRVMPRVQYWALQAVNANYEKISNEVTYWTHNLCCHTVFSSFLFLMSKVSSVQPCSVMNWLVWG